MKASKLDKIFDDDEVDLMDFMDAKSARQPNRKPQRVNVDFTSWTVGQLDSHAAAIGITRQALIKVWIDERLKLEAKS